MSEKRVEIVLHYEADLEVGLLGNIRTIDLGIDEDDFLSDKFQRAEFKKLLKPVIEFLYPEVDWWALGDECVECGGTGGNHDDGCVIYVKEIKGQI